MNYYWNTIFFNFTNLLYIWKIYIIIKFHSFFFIINNYSIFYGLMEINYFKIKQNFFTLKPNFNKIKLNFLKNTIFFFFYKKNIFILYNYLFQNIKLNYTVKNFLFLKIYKQTSGDGFLYLRGLFLIFFIDACVTDDEPLWEPIEWSLVQTWIFFIFIFAWIAENLITSRYGSYTGRDKRVWYAWYKTFWLIEFWYLISYGAATIFVIVPFYYELTYSISFIFSWWNWYSKVFFFKFISLYTIVLLISYYLLINIRWFNWKKIFFLTLLINFFLAYLLYFHFIMVFFGYFTNPLWYQKNRMVDYIQLSHEPLKWGWGTSKRDHFTYHKTSTVFWFKNDNQFAGSFLMIHLFLFLCLFFLYLYWIVLLRKIYTTKEVSFTFTTYCVSALRQFFYFFLFLFIFIFISFIISYWRFPIEFIWIINANSWLYNFIIILKEYLIFLM